MRSSKCELCGGKTKEVSENSFFKAVDGSLVHVRNFFRECQSCRERVLDGTKTDKAIARSKVAHYKDGTRELVQSISARHSVSSLERNLGLPLRSFNRWKNDGGSSTTFLMLKMLDTFPFIAEVAAKNFDRDSADLAILRESRSAFERLSHKHDFKTEVTTGMVSNVSYVMYSASPSTATSKSPVVDSVILGKLPALIGTSK